MCWVALDRAIRLAGPLRAGDRYRAEAGVDGLSGAAWAISEATRPAS